jgi:hypothetical protein
LIPPFDDSGNLPPGVHEATWDEIADRFGITPQRRALLAGLYSALQVLQSAGCQRVYIDGSFVTTKLVVPNDFDACWDIEGVDPDQLDPVLLTFDDRRAAQKAKYLGELFPAQLTEGGSGGSFLEFSKLTKKRATRKGSSPLTCGEFHDQKRTPVSDHESAGDQA